MTGHLDTAAAIGRRVVRQAVWHEGRCSWVGALPPSPASGAPRAAAALDACLHAGTAGVALFLAHLHDRTGDPRAGRAALGAARHSLAAAGALPGPGLALHTGRLGVALAAVRCGRLLRSAELAEAGRALGEAVLDDADPPGHDLVAGVAGAVAGLLALTRETGDERPLRRAEALGDTLRAGAREPGLTGMAHGAAGLVHALLELHAATGDERLLGAARQAAAFEGTHFDARAGNWADRRPRSARESGDIGAASAMGWCHGAPGIVLSRRRAAGRLGPDDEERARAGARTVETWLLAAIRTGRGNLSLCHGLTGNAEALCDAGEAAGTPAGGWPATWPPTARRSTGGTTTLGRAARPTARRRR